MATTKFYQKLINAIDKIETVGLDEKNDKADLIIELSRKIGKRGMSCVWNKGKWNVKLIN